MDVVRLEWEGSGLDVWTDLVLEVRGRELCNAMLLGLC